VLPEGFAYQEAFVLPHQERNLIEHFSSLDFREFEFHGYRGKRRVVSFGLHYDFSSAKLQPARELPGFLLPLRQAAAGFAGIPAQALSQALVTEYSPGAGIGWHRDRSVFDLVIGISLASSCRLRFRRKTGTGWQRTSTVVEARTAYLLQGSARSDWEHSISPMETLRYSVTFRSLKSAAKAR
jgi:alkylated DNA repair dioxygenase AlkB